VKDAIGQDIKIGKQYLYCKHGSSNISMVKVRRIYSKTLHLEWDGDGKFFGIIKPNKKEILIPIPKGFPNE